MGSHVDTRLKLDKSFALNLMSTEPRPIKVTNLADGIISSNKKAIENTKTGKVTAIAAVMYHNRNNKLNLCNANSKKSERLMVTARQRPLGSCLILDRAETSFLWKKDLRSASPL
jgi:hypothetical protein